MDIDDNLEVLDYDVDLWTVSCGGFPCGVIETKCPNDNGTSIMNDTAKLGQLLDYLNITRSFYGLQTIYGILTDYNEWRICWVGGEDGIANRNINCSPVYRRDSPSLPVAIATFLCKISEQSLQLNFDSVKLWDENRQCVCLFESGWEWRSKPKNVSLSLEPPAKTSNRFYLLRDYYGGTDGKVWLAADSEGHLCVVKFLREVGDGEEAKVQQEVNNWHRAGIASAFSCRLNSRPAAIFPYAFPCIRDANDQLKFCLSLNKWFVKASEPPLDAVHCDNVLHFPEVADVVKLQNPVEILGQCITSFAEKKLVQEDLEWRHVAVVPMFQSGAFKGVQPCFIDLGRVREVDSVEEAQTEMAAKQSTLSDIFEK